MIEMETNKKEETNAPSSNVESLVEHKFVVSFDHIKMKIGKAADCNIKYSYSIFGTKEFISPEFSIAPGNDEFQEIDAYWEHIIKPEEMNGGQLKKFLDDNPIEIKVFEQNAHLGTVAVNLSKLYEPNSTMVYQDSIKENLNIISEKNHPIGSLDCLFILLRENCVRCKVCNKINKESSIRKHIGQKKECKRGYSEEDMKTLISQSKKRKNEVEVSRQNRKYDPKKRAEKHKNTYDKKKRSAVYEKEKIKMKASKEESWRKDLKKSLIEEEVKKAKEYNSDARDQSNKRFQCGLDIMKRLKIEAQSHQKVKDLKDQIESLAQFLEIEDILKELNDVPTEGAFAKIIGEKFEEFNIKVCNQWHDLQLKIDLEFKEVAKKKGISFTCQNEMDYCPLSCRVNTCHRSRYCQDHEKISDSYRKALVFNRYWEKETKKLYYKGFEIIQKLTSLKAPPEPLKKLLNNIEILQERFNVEIHGLFADNKQMETDDPPLQKELCEEWHGMMKMIDIAFRDIASQHQKLYECPYNWIYCTFSCNRCNNSHYCQDHKED